MKNRIRLSARVVLALALGLGVVILAACAKNSSNNVVGVVAAPTVDGGPAETATAVERLIEEIVAATVMELRIETAVAATVRAARTATAAAQPTATSTATATPAPIETPTPTPTPTALRGSMELGLCLNPWFHPPTEDQLRELGVGWVRFVVRQSELPELGDVLAQYGKVGMKVLLVVNQETLPMMEGDLWKYGEDFSEEFLRLFRTHGRFVSAWEIWNEPEDGRRFKHLPEPDYLRLLELCFDKVKAVNPFCTILATGYPTSVNVQRDDSGRVLGRRLRCDGYAHHPYGGQMNGFPAHYGYPADWSIWQVYLAVGVPIWITEFGAPLKDFSPLEGEVEGHQARYLAEAVEVFCRLEFVRVACYFAWADSNDTDNGSRYGLMSFDGRERLAFEVFKSLARSR